MKEYIYNQPVPCKVKDSTGELFDLKNGDTVITYDGKIFKFLSHCFAATQINLREDFMRVYTVEELNRYDRIYENAMIAAMQTLIANLKDVKISSDMYEIELVPKNAIWFANRLVEELKEKEY